MVGLSLTEQ